MIFSNEDKSNALQCLSNFYNRTFTQNGIEHRPQAKIRTRTVEEINRMVDNKENDKIFTNDSPVVKKCLIDRDKIKNELLPFVRQSLDECYMGNPVQISCQDESSDSNAMVLRFQEAQNGQSNNSGSFQDFLNYIYHYLKMFFRNETCQKIMNCMIYKELENRYIVNSQEFIGADELKELFGNCDKSENGMPSLMSLKQFVKEQKKETVLKCNNRSGVQNSGKKDCMIIFSKNLLAGRKCKRQSEGSKLKSSEFWESEKLFRESLTSKTSVVLHKIDDVILNQKREDSISKVKVESLKELKCEVCSSKFKTVENLKKHENFHPKCDFCNKWFYTSWFLELHVKMEHEKSLDCNVCDLKFQNYNDMEFHFVTEQHLKNRENYIEILD